ncbi:MAG: exopolygalacturonase PelB [Calditrichia bacterium]
MKKYFSQSRSIHRVFGIFFATIIALCLVLSSCDGYRRSVDSGWEQVPEILSQIVPPTFPERDFLITDYGAIGDGQTDCSEAFARAIRACSEAGGGRVVVPEGIFLTGAIHLKSNVNLHITKNATIRFSTDPQKYLPVVYTRFEGVECMNYSPFIYAYEAENIAITGSGTLDGQAGNDNWWQWKGRAATGWEAGEPNQNRDREALFRMGEEGLPVQERIFGENHYLRPNFIQPYKCKNILIDSITVVRSPMWEIHPVLCENVTVQNVRVISHGPNNDGCNPESSKNVLIRNSYFDTGDDCIAIKSGRNADGRRVNVHSENIVIQKCTMKDGHGGVVIGSEMSGGVRNIFVEDCVMDSPNLERALRIKTNSMRGGVVENIFMRNVTVGEVSDAVIRVNFNYGEGDVGNHIPVVRNIYIKNVTSKKSQYALYLAGYERSVISNFFLENCRFDGVEKGNMLMHYQNLNMKNVFINGQIVS